MRADAERPQRNKLGPAIGDASVTLVCRAPAKFVKVSNPAAPTPADAFGVSSSSSASSACATSTPQNIGCREPGRSPSSSFCSRRRLGAARCCLAVRRSIVAFFRRDPKDDGAVQGVARAIAATESQRNNRLLNRGSSPP